MNKLCALLLLLAAGLAGAREPAGKVEVVLLKPNKIMYTEGEAGTAVVDLYNTTDAALDVALKPRLIRDLDEALDLPAVTVAVPAKEKVRATFPLPATPGRWGREVRVQALVDGKVEDTGRQFYGVNNEWMDHILISFKRRFSPLADELEPFHTYTTVEHWFAWAPGDYTDNAPAYNEWYSGQAGYHLFKDQLQEKIRKCHEQGIHCTFYNNSFTGGKSGLEWARRHPGWIARNRDGSPKINGDPLALTKPHSDKATGSMGGAMPAFYDLECIKWGAQNTIESVEMFGWDGMFWDCGGLRLFPSWTYDGQPSPHGQDPDAISARNFRVFHNMVREKYPHFGIWINGSIDHFRQPFWSQFGNGGGMATAEEQFSTPQTALLIELRHHSTPGVRQNKWQWTQKQYVKERDTITQKYGSPIIAGYTTFTGFPAQSHLAALLLASQIRPANCHQEGSWPMTQFMTRYSAFLWQRDITVVPDPAGLVAAETSRPVWWQDYLYRRPTPTGEDIIVHFVNQPITETVDTEQKENPPGATATVAFTVPAGRKLARVVCCTPRLFRPGVDDPAGLGLDVGGMPVKVDYVPDPENPDKKIRTHTTGSLVRGGPTQVDLTVTTKGNVATVEVPEFVYHTMLVFRLEE